MRFQKGDRLRCIDIKAIVHSGDIPGFTIGKIYVVHANHGVVQNGYDCLEVEDDNAVLRFVNSKRFELENLPTGLTLHHDDLIIDEEMPPGKVRHLISPRCDCGGYIFGTHDDNCCLVISGHWSKYKTGDV